MTLLDLSHRGSGLGNRLADAVSRMAAARARRSLYRRTVRELGLLSDRELADLGVNRASIHSVARDAAAARLSRRFSELVAAPTMVDHNGLSGAATPLARQAAASTRPHPRDR